MPNSGGNIKTLDLTEEIYLGIFVGLSVLAAVYHSYHVIRFYKNRRKQGYLKRHPNIVVFINVFIIIHVGLYGSFRIMSNAYERKFVNYQKINVHPAYVYAMFSNIFYSFCAHGPTLGLLGRTWIIYYNSKWKQETLVC